MSNEQNKQVGSSSDWYVEDWYQPEENANLSPVLHPNNYPDIDQVQAGTSADMQIVGGIEGPIDPLSNLGFISDTPLEPFYIGTDWQQRPPNNEPIFPYEKIYLKTEILTRVQFLRLLGEGAFGSVWEVSAFLKTYLKPKGQNPYANPVWTRLRLACKIIRHSDVSEETILDSLNEMRTLRYLRHENICNMIDVIGIPDRATHFPYSAVIMFFELCDGTLEELIKRIRLTKPKSTQGGYTLPESLSRHWFAQMIRALDYLHSKRIVHKDIHMGNILYCGPDLVHKNDEIYFLSSLFKLADFGVSRDMTPNLTPAVYGWTVDRHIASEERDIRLMVHVLLDTGVPLANLDIDVFINYCRTGHWSDTYPQEWRQISPAMKDLLWKLQDNVLTAPDILSHEWLQDNYHGQSQRFIYRPPKLTYPYTIPWEL